LIHRISYLLQPNNPIEEANTVIIPVIANDFNISLELLFHVIVANKAMKNCLIDHFRRKIKYLLNPNPKASRIKIKVLSIITLC